MMHTRPYTFSAPFFGSGHQFDPAVQSFTPYDRQDFHTIRSYSGDYNAAYAPQDWTSGMLLNEDRMSAYSIPPPSIDTMAFSQPYSFHSRNFDATSTSIASSSIQSERHDTPQSSSDIAAFSPPVYPTGQILESPVAFQASITTQHPPLAISGGTSFEDSVDEPLFDSVRPAYRVIPQADLPTFHHVERQSSAAVSETIITDSEEPSQDADSDYTPSGRSRRSSGRAARPTNNRKKISKRSAYKRASTSAMQNTMSDGDDSISDRPFHCPLAPYGCKSTFSSKNEWKRHFGTQHMRLGYWQCDQCPGSLGRKSNEFNRKDLFVQHVRRMHSKIKPVPSTRRNKTKQARSDCDDYEATEAAKRCHIRTRLPPSQSICPICREMFYGISSWDKRMEHMGKHFEDVKRGNTNDYTALNVEGWYSDDSTESWMLEQGVIVRTGDGTYTIANEHRE